MQCNELMMSFSKEDFKKDYAEFGKSNLVSQMPHLRKLSDVYLQKCRETNHWMDYVKAHGLLNACKIRTSVVDKAQEIELEIYELEMEWYRLIGIQGLQRFDDWKTMTSKHKKQLEQNRLDAKRDFDKTYVDVADKIDMEHKILFNKQNAKVFSEFSSRVYRDSISCTDKMIQFAKQLCVDSESIIGKPPCNYVVIALGSIARGEATPYSDLEYAFLVENKEDRTYFFNLAMDTYFRIANLGETPLKYFYIEELCDWYDSADGGKLWFEDEAKSGFKIDGFTPRAGNIPTGNGGRELILTPHQLMEIYKDCFSKEKTRTTKTGDDSHLLSSVIMLHLYPDDSSLLDEFLQLKMIFEDQIERDPLAIEKKLTTLQKDINNYKYSPGIVSNVKDNPAVKTDIFRYPTLLAHDLKILFGFHDCASAKEVFETLHHYHIINDEVHEHLQFILMAAIWIRTSAYLNSGTQRESLSFYPQNTDEASASDRFYIPKELFIPMNCCLVPIKEHLLGCFGSALETTPPDCDIVKRSFSSIMVSKVDFVIRCRLHYACGDSLGGLQHLEQALEKRIGITSPDELLNCIKEHSIAVQYQNKEYSIVQLASHMLFHQGKFNVAEIYFQWLYDTLRALPVEPSDVSKGFKRDALVCLLLKSQCLLMLGKHIEAYTSFLKTRKEFIGYYKSQGAKNTSEAVVNVFLDIVSGKFSNSDFEVARWISINSQIIFDSIRYHQGRIGVVKRSFQHLLKIYGKFEDGFIKAMIPNQFYPALGYFCLTIALCYDIQFANFAKAEEYQKKAKAQFETCLGKAALTVDTVATQLMEASLCIRKGDYTGGENVSLATLNLLPKLEASLSHQAFQCHHNLAVIYLHTKRFDKSLEQLDKSQDIIAKHEQRSPFRQGILCMTYAQMFYATDFFAKAKIKIVQTMAFFKDAFKDREVIKTHPDVADAQRISAQIDAALDNIDQARVSIGEALRVLILSYGEESAHPSIAEAYFVQAELKKKEGKLSEAVDICIKSIDMVKEKFGDASTHPALNRYESFLGDLLACIH